MGARSAVSSLDCEIRMIAPERFADHRAVGDVERIQKVLAVAGERIVEVRIDRAAGTAVARLATGTRGFTLGRAIRTRGTAGEVFME
jgi:hypothetical protein